MKYFVKYNEHIESNITLYHGGFSKFDNFDITKLRKGGSQTTYGYGIYMTDSKGYAKSYITGENGVVSDNEGYLYEVTISNANFLKFGEIINGEIEHSQIDEKNYSLIINQLEKEGISLVNRDGEPVTVNREDLVWTVYDTIARSFYEGFSIQQQMRYGDFESKKMASEFLVRCGIDGMQYPLENSTKMSTSFGYDGYAYVIYNTSIIKNNEIIETT